MEFPLGRSLITAVPVDHGKKVIGLLPGSSRVEYLASETPRQVSMFINHFMDIKGDLPTGEFQALGCVHSSDKY